MRTPRTIAAVIIVLAAATIAVTTPRLAAHAVSAASASIVAPIQSTGAGSSTGIFDDSGTAPVPAVATSSLS